MDYYSDINLEIIDNVREKIIDGAVIIYPTETVWALGCNASNSKSDIFPSFKNKFKIKVSQFV